MMNWNSTQFTNFAVDSDRNMIIIRKMLKIIGVIQSNHQSERIRNLDWKLPLKHALGRRVMDHWLFVNDPKRYSQRHYLHVFWKWNDFPDIEFNDVDPNDVFGERFDVETVERVRARYNFTSGQHDLWPEEGQRFLLIYVMDIFYFWSKKYVRYWITFTALTFFCVVGWLMATFDDR